MTNDAQVTPEQALEFLLNLAEGFVGETAITEREEAVKMAEIAEAIAVLRAALKPPKMVCAFCFAEDKPLIGACKECFAKLAWFAIIETEPKVE